VKKWVVGKLVIFYFTPRTVWETTAPIKMGRMSLLNKVMDMDDELLEMMTVETKQTTISDFFKPV
jgi:hypothetical protein